MAVYLNPANFKNIGDGHTIAGQINEILEPYDLGVIAASNDRIGGWQLMYQMLQTGQRKIADTCPKLIEAIPTRMHHEKKPGDVLKVPGDPLDDVPDDARYGIYTFITTTEKPRELVIAEDIRRLAQQSDITSAAIRGAQRMAEAQVSHNFGDTRCVKPRRATSVSFRNGEIVDAAGGRAARSAPSS